MHALDAPLPAWSVPLLREALATQGIARGAITDSGELDTGLLATSLMDTVTIRTNITPDFTINVRESVQGPSSPVTRALQPTLMLHGGVVGHRVIAPYGESKAGGLVFAGLVAVVAAGAWRFFKRRRA